VAKREKKDPSAEPIGIVISRGSSVEPAPMFWAYVWGPAPEADAAPAEAVRR
jgi:hypothetical protein